VQTTLMSVFQIIQMPLNGGLQPATRKVKKLRRPLNAGDSCTSEI
jgi:hypothetical protein